MTDERFRAIRQTIMAVAFDASARSGRRLSERQYLWKWANSLPPYVAHQIQRWHDPSFGQIV